ncbi:MAG: metalloregulator ArsR/SmtB family transcription factor [Fimbriimonas sp.]|nr:metalloregulator ArsR/SmtB family transcription factor [Fimbriimonas sp.]
MSEAIRKYKAEVFQALAHPTRVAIIELLHDGELSVGELCQKLSLEPANVSKHLTILRSKSILSARKVANSVFYSIRDPAISQVFLLLRGFCVTHVAEMSRMVENDEPAAATSLSPS